MKDKSSLLLKIADIAVSARLFSAAVESLSDQEIESGFTLLSRLYEEARDAFLASPKHCEDTHGKGK